MSLTPQALASIRLFHGLSPTQMDWISARLRSRVFPPTTDLVIEGEPGEIVYFILSGSVKVYLPQLDGSQVIVNIQGQGDMIGELSAIDQAGRSASVITLELTQTAWLTREHFLETLHTIPAANDNLLRLLVGQVRRTTALIRAYAALDVPGRIARQLLDLSEAYGYTTPQGTYIPLSLPQGEIAELVGSSRKRANQVMVALKRSGALSADSGGHITLHRPELLRELIK
jgi:CRP/FNR family cyclic AMP-dependent transcriptional regulator